MSRFSSIKMMAASFLICLMFAGYSTADTFTVMNLDDSGEGSLRQAVADANTNENGPEIVDEIVFADGLAGTIEFDELMNEAELAEPVGGKRMIITDDVNIIGPGKDVITISAMNQDRIFSIGDEFLENKANAVEEGIKVSISGLKFTNGSDKTGGAIFNRGELSVDSCEFYKNQAVLGGAIFNTPSAMIAEIKDSDFIMNSADIGGAIALEGEPDGPIIKFEPGETPAADLVKLSGSTFDQNIASFGGGAIGARNGATIYEITDTSFTNNEGGEDGGGGIYIDGTQEINEEKLVEAEQFESGYHLMTLSDCEFSNNTAAAGGAILNIEGKIETISDCDFIGNNAIGFEDPKKLLVEDPEPEPNTFAAGGAVANVGGFIANIMRTTFSSNTALGFGGAIVNAAQVQQGFPDDGPGREAVEVPKFKRALIMNIQDSTFDENMARISGGAIGNGSGSIEMVNATFSENFADVSGGAIYNLDTIQQATGGGEEEPIEVSTSLEEVEMFTAPVVFASFTTFARNEAGVEGGGVHEEIIEDDPKSIHLRHSILYQNIGGNCGGLPLEDEGGNHSDDDTCPLIDGNMATMVLGDLADNGGPTQTVALLEGDPVDSAVECTAITMFGGEEEVETDALDPIVPVDLDQRGAPRAFGDSCDAGAFEFGATVPGGFFHNPIFPAIAGNPNMLTAEEATSEGPVAFLWGFMPGSVVIGGKTCNGTEIGIKQPRLLAIVDASTEGMAELIFFIPTIGDFELSLRTQAVDVMTCATSEVIEEIITKQ